MEGKTKEAATTDDAGGRAAHVLFLALLGLSGLLFFTQTIPAFQEEKVVAGELRRARKERRRLEKIRDLYKKKARAISEDPQEALRLYLELKSKGLVR
ncbi:MAG TPA: hypothetical protein ENJ97_00380 [Planctomycetes bacterium]|nr:hypothetical protein [Planctomycetota bacterium]